jgi:hypothetical protein
MYRWNPAKINEEEEKDWHYEIKETHFKKFKWFFDKLEKILSNFLKIVNGMLRFENDNRDKKLEMFKVRISAHIQKFERDKMSKLNFNWFEAIKNSNPENKSNGKLILIIYDSNSTLESDISRIIHIIEAYHYDRRIFVNTRSEKKWRNFQEKIENTFLGEYKILSKNEGTKDGPKTGNYRNLQIDFDIFIDCFIKEEALLEKYKEDVFIDKEWKTITISDWRIIPIIGTLRMLDDYKKGLVSEEWELSTYSTFEEAHSDIAYEEVKQFREKEGSTSEIFNNYITEYDKLYELKNLSRFLYYNGVRYFYFIQGKLDQIVEVETAFIIYFDANLLYDFIYITDPVALVFLCAETFNHRNTNINKLNETRNWVAQVVVKQLLLKEDAPKSENFSEYS